MKYVDYRNQMDIEYFPYLRYSAYLFLIPTVCFLYNKKYDLFFLLVIFSIFSILRWTYVKNKLYQNIDHNFVKVLFIIALYNTIISCVKCELTSLLILGCLINIFVFYYIGLFYDYYQNKKNIIFHMIVHLYTVFGFCLGINHFVSFLEK